jgi:hypothetical protein
MEVPKELKVALELTERTAAGKGKVATFAKEVASLLSRGIAQLPSTSGVGIISRAAKGGPEKVVYVVDLGNGQEEALAEHRTSGKSNPFRCPKSMYDAIVRVLGAAERAMSVEDIADDVGKLVGDRPAEFQVRVPLRLWLSVSPPLVNRNRARYRPIESDTFAVMAAQLWMNLRSE